MAKNKSPKIWFTSDEHFGSEKIITTFSRPFKNATKMAERIIKNHNKLVSDDDIVYHLGDFSHKDREVWRSKLAGYHHWLIVGDHDLIVNCGMHFGFDGIETSLILSSTMSDSHYQGVFLSHYPHRLWPSFGNGSIHLFGHVHSQQYDNNRSVSVAVDNWNYKPVSIDQILSYMRTLCPPR